MMAMHSKAITQIVEQKKMPNIPNDTNHINFSSLQLFGCKFQNSK